MSRRGPLIAGIVSGVVALLAVILLVLPKMREVGDTQDELRAAEDQEITLQAELRALQDAQASSQETAAEIQALDDQVPPTADLPELFRLLQAAADRAAVDFFQFSPGTPIADASGSFSVVPSQIVVTGGYFSVQEFLYNLEALARANKVISVAISPGGGAAEGGASTIATTGRLQLQATVEFYTTDSSSGPGSQPGPSTGTPVTPPAAETPAETPEPGV
jgi:type IV pilus assembly protein PilO